MMKKIYFATICLPPPLMLLIYPAIFLGGLPIPPEALMYYTFYFWIGLLVVIVDLWMSSLEKEKKILWSVLNTFLGIFCLPIYWFKYVLKKEVPARQC